ncbi:hypothetical protein AMS68_005578 [Peltaster fructicola]|uniref:PRA1 family protein n=1 Tax=Peltaster fructicola TaxID=286661 RepID=A0A6H0XZG3_9PEZI|nr:hypothetical protein AMS68_005578 [Peltaster fructicola]
MCYRHYLKYTTPESSLTLPHHHGTHQHTSGRAHEPSEPLQPPISEFLDVKRISKPRDFGEVQSRVNYNLSYFSSNYAVVFVMLSIYSLLNNLTLTFVIVLVVGGMYGIGKLEGRDLDLGFVRATSSQLYTALFVVAIPLGLWSSPFATMLWLIGATGVVILGHASLLEKDVSAEFADPPSAV